MPRKGREERLLILTETRALLTGGMGNADVLRELITRKGIQRRTARRYLAWAYASFARDARLKREAHINTAIAQRDRAMRMALTRQRHMLVNGVIEKVEDPDIKTFLDAADSKAKLLGIVAPERREVIIESFGLMFRDLVTTLREEIHDTNLLARVVTRLRASMDMGSRVALAGEMPPQQIEATVVRPNVNGTNGSTNGAAH